MVFVADLVMVDQECPPSFSHKCGNKLRTPPFFPFRAPHGGYPAGCLTIPWLPFGRLRHSCRTPGGGPSEQTLHNQLKSRSSCLSTPRKSLPSFVIHRCPNSIHIRTEPLFSASGYIYIYIYIIYIYIFGEHLWSVFLVR